MKKYHYCLSILIVVFSISSCGTFSKSKQNMNGKKYLAIGDSYTIGESVPETDRFPEQLVVALNEKDASFQAPEIIARTGWRTDQLITAIEQADLSEDYYLVTLLIGVNNEFQGESSAKFESELRVLCKTAIRLGGGKKKNVYVLSIPDYGFTPFGRRKQEQISVRIDEFNAIVKAVSTEMGLTFIDITPISRLGFDQKELVANDGLHPSGKMYSDWVKELIPVILD